MLDARRPTASVRPIPNMLVSMAKGDDLHKTQNPAQESHTTVLELSSDGTPTGHRRGDKSDESLVTVSGDLAANPVLQATTCVSGFKKPKALA